MVNVNELMVGDYVNVGADGCPPAVAVVEEIYGKANKVLLSICKSSVTFDADDISPIMLTKDFFLRNGFIECYISEYYMILEHYGYGLKIQLCPDSDSVHDGNYVHIADHLRKNTVHGFQHFLRSVNLFGFANNLKIQDMAKIIYKKGLNGQNKLECIEGIEINLLNGQCALVYPKYAELPLLDEDKIDKWRTGCIKEITALKLDDSAKVTDDLFILDSPAAKFVRQFKSDTYGPFNMPTLLAAKEIKDQMKYINECARYIDGADLLESGMDLSSCFRGGKNHIWSSSDEEYIGFKNTCVPTILYRKA